MKKKIKRPSRKGIAIKPYKGGRTKRFECRLTEAEEIIINALVEASGLSKSDWLMEMTKPTTGAVDLLHACACGDLIPTDEFRCLNCQRELDKN